MQPTHEYRYSSGDFQARLGELKPKIRSMPPLFAFAFWIMRLRTRKTRWLPRRIYSIFSPSFRRRAQSKTPLFVAKTNRGLSFIGDYGDNYSTLAATHPDYDASTVDFITERMQHLEGAFLDVGANMGILAASVAKSLQGRERVFAFEPVSETSERAAAVFALNQISDVALFECAIGDQDDTLRFYKMSGTSEASAAGANGWAKEDLIEIQVPCRSLDSLAAEGVIGKIGLLKLDVEGYEIKALQGARAVIMRDQPEIIFECHRDIMPHAGWELSDATSLIREMGNYEFYFLREEGGFAPLPLPISDRPDINIYCRSRSVSG